MGSAMPSTGNRYFRNYPLTGRIADVAQMTRLTLKRHRADASFDHLVGAGGQRERTLRRIGTSALRCRKATVFDQPSFEQSRGTMFILAAYLAESSLTIGSVTVSSAVYQPEITFHALPSHC